MMENELDVLDVVDTTHGLLEQVDAMVLLDAIADHLTAKAQTEAEQFQVQVLERAIKEIRKSRGLGY